MIEVRVPGENASAVIGAALLICGFAALLAALWLYQQNPPTGGASPTQLTQTDNALPKAKPSALKTAAAQEVKPAAQEVKPARATDSNTSDCGPHFEVYFRLGSVRPQNVNADIDALIPWLEKHPQARVLVEGHASHAGSAQKNLALSYRRARAVAWMIKRRGWREKITTRGLGFYQPLSNTNERDAMNRRVVVRVLGMPGCSGGER